MPLTEEELLRQEEELRAQTRGVGLAAPPPQAPPLDEPAAPAHGLGWSPPPSASFALPALPLAEELPPNVPPALTAPPPAAPATANLVEVAAPPPLEPEPRRPPEQQAILREAGPGLGIGAREQFRRWWSRFGTDRRREEILAQSRARLAFGLDKAEPGDSLTADEQQDLYNSQFGDIADPKVKATVFFALNPEAEGQIAAPADMDMEASLRELRRRDMENAREEQEFQGEAGQRGMTAGGGFAQFLTKTADLANYTSRFLALNYLLPGGGTALGRKAMATRGPMAAQALKAAYYSLLYGGERAKSLSAGDGDVLRLAAQADGTEAWLPATGPAEPGDRWVLTRERFSAPAAVATGYGVSAAEYLIENHEQLFKALSNTGAYRALAQTLGRSKLARALGEIKTGAAEHIAASKAGSAVGRLAAASRRLAERPLPSAMGFGTLWGEIAEEYYQAPLDAIERLKELDPATGEEKGYIKAALENMAYVVGSTPEMALSFLLFGGLTAAASVPQHNAAVRQAKDEWLAERGVSDAERAEILGIRDKKALKRRLVAVDRRYSEELAEEGAKGLAEATGLPEDAVYISLLASNPELRRQRLAELLRMSLETSWELPEAPGALEAPSTAPREQNDAERQAAARLAFLAGVGEQSDALIEARSRGQFGPALQRAILSGPAIGPDSDGVQTYLAERGGGQDQKRASPPDVGSAAAPIHTVPDDPLAAVVYKARGKWYRSYDKGKTFEAVRKGSRQEVELEDRYTRTAAPAGVLPGGERGAAGSDHAAQGGVDLGSSASPAMVPRAKEARVARLREAVTALNSSDGVPPGMSAVLVAGPDGEPTIQLRNVSGALPASTVRRIPVGRNADALLYSASAGYGGQMIGMTHPQTGAPVPVPTFDELAAMPRSGQGLTRAWFLRQARRLFAPQGRYDVGHDRMEIAEAAGHKPEVWLEELHHYFYYHLPLEEQRAIDARWGERDTRGDVIPGSGVEPSFRSELYRTGQGADESAGAQALLKIRSGAAKSDAEAFGKMERRAMEQADFGPKAARQAAEGALEREAALREKERRSGLPAEGLRDRALLQTLDRIAESQQKLADILDRVSRPQPASAFSAAERPAAERTARAEQPPPFNLQPTLPAGGSEKHDRVVHAGEKNSLQWDDARGLEQPPAGKEWMLYALDPEEAAARLGLSAEEAERHIIPSDDGFFVAKAAAVAWGSFGYKKGGQWPATVSGGLQFYRSPSGKIRALIQPLFSFPSEEMESAALSLDKEYISGSFLVTVSEDADDVARRAILAAGFKLPHETQEGQRQKAAKQEEEFKAEVRRQREERSGPQRDDPNIPAREAPAVSLQDATAINPKTGRRQVPFRLYSDGYGYTDDFGPGGGIESVMRAKADITVKYAAPAETMGVFAGSFTGGGVEEIAFVAHGVPRYAYVVEFRDIDSWSQEWWVSRQRLTGEAAIDAIERARVMASPYLKHPRPRPEIPMPAGVEDIRRARLSDIEAKVGPPSPFSLRALPAQAAPHTTKREEGVSNKGARAGRAIFEKEKDLNPPEGGGNFTANELAELIAAQQIPAAHRPAAERQAARLSVALRRDDRTPYLPGFTPDSGAQAPAPALTPPPDSPEESAQDLAWRKGQWQRAFDEGKGRVSRILPALLRREIKSVNLRGVRVSNPADAAAVLAAIEAPDLLESFRAIYLDAANAVLEARVLSLGILDAALAHPREVFGNMPAGTAAVVLGHNHPSGSQTPSPEDIELTETMARAAYVAGVRLLDHVVINGGFHSIREDGTVREMTGEAPVEVRSALPAPVIPTAETRPAPTYEGGRSGTVRTPSRHELTSDPLDAVNFVRELTASLRPSAGHAVYAIGLGAQHNIQSVYQFPPEATAMEIARTILRYSGQDAVVNFLVCVPFQGDQPTAAQALARELFPLSEVADIRLLDVVWPSGLDGYESLRESGAFDFSFRPPHPGPAEALSVALRRGEGTPFLPGFTAAGGGAPAPIATEQAESQGIQDFGEKIGGARKDIAERGYALSKREKPVDQQPAWRKKYVVGESIHNPGQWSILKAGDSWGLSGRRGQTFASEAEAEAAIPLYAVAESHAVHRDAGGKHYIYKRVGKRKLLKVVRQGFDSREDALKHMAANAVALLEQKTSFGEEILPIPEIATRTGAQRRTQDATPEMFVETFAPRGIEFGNWQNQEERQMVMNHAFDGLLDLADALGLPPRALMLNGDLAVAFGARGHGLDGAKAHYEADYGVINLTKMKGAGALAHEWMHALDHYLARLDTKAKSEKVKNARGDLVYPVESQDRFSFQSHGPSYKSQLREELKTAYNELVEGLYRKAEKYVEDTQAAEKFLGNAKRHLREILDRIRSDLQRDYTQYHARGGAPATAEQLAEFDRLADILVEGGSLDLKWVSLKPPGRRFAIPGGHDTNDTLDAISQIYKAVRNRSGFTDQAGKNSPLGDVAAAIRLYSQRIQMLADSKKGTEKIKPVTTRYAMEARKMDQARSGDYWSGPHEMVARAFAAYVEDKIAEKGGQSDFLVYHAHGGILLPMIDGFVARPYPEGDERKSINAAFDKFVGAIKTRETDRGVAIFSLAPATLDDLAAWRDAKPKEPVSKSTIEELAGQLDVAPERLARALWEEGLAEDIGDLTEGQARMLLKVGGWGAAQDFLGAIADAARLPGAGAVFSLKPTPTARDEQHAKAIRGDSGKDPLTKDVNQNQWATRNPKSAKALRKIVEAHAPEKGFTRRPGERYPFLDLLRKVQYMRLRQAVPPQDMLRQIGGLPGVKTQEIEESGLKDWLGMLQEQGRRATRADAVAFLERNGLRIEEVRKGVPIDAEEARAAVRRGENVWPADRQQGIPLDEAEILDGLRYVKGGQGAKFMAYAPPGGVPGTYREVLLTAPSEQGKTAEAYRKMGATNPPATPDAYRSPHWTESNVITHMLMDERRIPLDALERTQPELAAKLRAEGKTEARALHMIEGQSDLHQEAASRGYRSREYIPVNESAFATEDVPQMTGDAWGNKKPTGKMELKITRPDGSWTIYGAGTTPEFAKRKEAAEWNAKQKREWELSGLPSLPMRGDAWKRLVIRKMLAEAASGGYDLLTWSTGEDRFKKWGSQRVDWKRTGYDRELTPQERAAVESSGGIVTRTGPSWIVSAVEQTGGEHGGMNIEQMARERGVLLESKGRTVRTKNDLRSVIKSINRGDETNVDKLTSRVWDRMQVEPEGTSLPRKEFFEFLYDQSFVNEARDIARKMDKTAPPVEVGLTQNTENGIVEMKSTDDVREYAHRGGYYFANGLGEVVTPLEAARAVKSGDKYVTAVPQASPTSAVHAIPITAGIREGTRGFYESGKRIKLGDLATFRDDGAPIPPSERFNPESPDVRFSVAAVQSEARRFDKLTGGRQAGSLSAILAAEPDASAKQAALERWIESHPEEYDALEKLKVAALRRRGYTVGPVWHGRKEKWTVAQGRYDDTRQWAEHEGLLDNKAVSTELEQLERLGAATWFTEDESIAYGYFDQARGGDVLPAMLRASQTLDLRVKTAGIPRIEAVLAAVYGEPVRIDTTYSAELGVARAIVRDNSKLVRWARDNGFDAVVHDDTDITGRYTHTSWIVWNSEQIKSAAPLSLDDQGNLIGPEQWGDPESPDIRFSLAPATLDDLAAWRDAKPKEPVSESTIEELSGQLDVQPERLAKVLWEEGLAEDLGDLSEGQAQMLLKAGSWGAAQDFLGGLADAARAPGARAVFSLGALYEQPPDDILAAAQKNAGFPVRNGSLALLLHGKSTKTYRVRVEQIVDAETVRVAPSGSSGNTTRFRSNNIPDTVPISELIEPPAQRSARMRAEILRSIAPEDRAAVAAAKEFNDLLFSDPEFFPLRRAFEMEELLGARERAYAKAKGMHEARRYAFRALGLPDDMDRMDPRLQAQYLPALKEYIARRDQQEIPAEPSDSQEDFLFEEDAGEGREGAELPFSVAPREQNEDGERRPVYTPDYWQSAVRSTPLPQDIVILPTISLARVKRHSGWEKAKAGDMEAARRLVRDVAHPEMIASARALLRPGDLVAPVIAEERSGLNAIPAALAEYICEQTGARYFDEVVQTISAHHTGALAVERLARRAGFSGPVPAGARVLLVDDHLTMGGTQAELFDYFSKQGATPLGFGVLSMSGIRDRKLAPDPAAVAAVKAKHGEDVRNELGIEPEALTSAEARYLLSIAGGKLSNKAWAARLAAGFAPELRDTPYAPGAKHLAPIPREGRGPEETERQKAVREDLRKRLRNVVGTGRKPMTQQQREDTIVALERAFGAKEREFAVAQTIAAARMQKDALLAQWRDEKADIRAQVASLRAYARAMLTSEVDQERADRAIEDMLAATHAATRQRRSRRGEDMIERLFDEQCKREYLSGIMAMLARARPKLRRNATIRGPLDAVTHTDLSVIETAILGSAAGAQGEIDAMVEQSEAREDTEWTPEEATRIAILQTYGGLFERSVDEVAAAYNELAQLLTARRWRHRVVKEAQSEDRAQKRKMAVEVITGGEGYKGAGDIRRQRRTGRWGRALDNIGDTLRAFDDKLQSWPWFLDKLSRLDRASKPLQSRLSQRFAPLVHEATHAENADVNAAFRSIRALAERAYNKTGGDLFRALAERARPRADSGVYLYPFVDREKYSKGLDKVYQARALMALHRGEGERIAAAEALLREGLAEMDAGGQRRKADLPEKLSVAEASDLWMKWQAPQLRDQLALQGVTADTAEQVEEFLERANPGSLAFAIAVLSEFYPSWGEELVPVFERFFSVPFPNVRAYSPLRREHYGEAQDDPLLKTRTTRGTVLVSAVKARLPNRRDILFSDADKLLLRHVIETAHFKHWVEPIAEMRSVLGSEEVSKAIQQYHGPAAAAVMGNFLDSFARGGADRAAVVRGVDKWISAHASAVLALNLSLFPKQAVSFPAYALAIPLADFFRGVGEALSHPKATADFLFEHSRMMRESRYNRGVTIEMMMALADNSSGVISGAGGRRLREAAMLPMKAGDATAVILGGWSVYRHAERRLREEHPDWSADLIRENAIRQFETQTELYQQAGAPKDLAFYQKAGSFAKLFMMYKTAQASYYRAAAGAVRNLATGRETPAQAAKTLVIVGIILPLLFEFIASGFRITRRGVARAAVAIFDGLPFLGDLLSNLTEAMVDTPRWGDNALTPPPVAAVEPLFTAAGDIREGITEGWTAEDVLATADKLAQVVATLPGAGVPYAGARRFYKAVRDVAAGETEYPVRRLMGFTERTLGEDRNEEDAPGAGGLYPAKGATWIKP